MASTSLASWHFWHEHIFQWNLTLNMAGRDSRNAASKNSATLYQGDRRGGMGLNYPPMRYIVRRECWSQFFSNSICQRTLNCVSTAHLKLLKGIIVILSFILSYSFKMFWSSILIFFGYHIYLICYLYLNELQ